MGRKIFISYKYADNQVQNLPMQSNSTVRDYVDVLEKLIDTSDHIYKAESSGEDLSNLQEETIWSKLRDRIFDSTLTLIMISPNMREKRKQDRDQWIPWEVSFSLRTQTRKTQSGNTYTSNPNALLAVVLPDIYGSYEYFLQSKNCCQSGCRLLKTDTLFEIIRNNMFNNATCSKRICNTGSTIWSGSASYIASVKWCDFLKDMDTYINESYDRQKHLDDYDIHIQL